MVLPHISNSCGLIKHITRRENNELMKMLIFLISFNKRLGMKLQLILEGTITVTGLEKFNFLRNCFKKKIKKINLT